MSEHSTALLGAARHWCEAGCSVLPVRDDGSKAPALRTWKEYQSTPADPAKIDRWFANGSNHGVGVVTGQVSGHLEMFELEGRAVLEGLVPALTAALAEHAGAGLWTTLNSGYLELTPSGGLHWYYRVDGPVRGNTKLARRPATNAELEINPDEKVKVLIETRGEGGYTVVAPTPATHHPLGRPWQAVIGSPDTIPTITADDRDLLYAVATLFDKLPPAPTYTEPPSTKSGNGGGLRPGDAYNQRASWDDILVPEGWTRVHKLGKGWAWRRPGKDKGISATTGTRPEVGDNLYVFSTSTDFDAERSYDKFGAYTLLNHGGLSKEHFKEATKALRREGYGEELKPPRPTRSTSNVTPIRPDVKQGEDGSSFDGNAARDTASTDTVTPSPRYTDDGNAVALIEAHGNDLRYCHERGRWLTWDEHRWAWQPSSGGEAREYVKDVARALPVTDKPSKMWQDKSLSALGTTNCLMQASTDRRMVVPLTELDAEAWSLNTPAGVVDLKTGALGDLNDHALHTRSTTVAPDPDADQTVWLTFLRVTFNEDAELIGYMQRLVGYSATGYIGPHVLPFAYGSGGNGKGVFLEAIGKVLGDYATTGPNSFLMAKQHVGHDTEIARLSGARMVLCSEVNETDRFDEAKVKQLTGGDTLTARFMRQDFFSFEPTHHLWLMGNHKPTVTTGGRSFWRRCRLIPFLHEVPKEDEIDDLQGILARDHGPAILSWIIAGAVAFARDGLVEPESVTAATAAYASEQDTVQRFVDEMCTLSDSNMVKTEVGVMASVYIRWCEEMGEEPVSGKRLSMDLANRYGVRSGRDMRRRWYLGIALEEGSSGQSRPPDPSWPEGGGVD